MAVICTPIFQGPGKNLMKLIEIKLEFSEMKTISHCSFYFLIFIFSIEKSREVIPTLIEAAKSKQKHETLNWEHVYKLLFTRDNLKLVQVGCHKKAAREQKCNIKDFLVS